MRVSNSKLKKYLRCANAYRYKYVEGWTPKVRGVALERGSWVHDLLQHYYDGEDWKARHKELTQRFYSLFEEQREDLGDLPNECLALMKRYLRHYPSDLDRYIVIDSELDEIVELPDGTDLQIIIDLVVEDRVTRNLWLWDHKTRKKMQDSDQSMLDPQLTLYHYGAVKMGYTPLAGICINEICTVPPTVPERLKSGQLTTRANLRTDVYTYMKELKKYGLSPENYTETLQRLAVVHSETFFRRSWMPKDPPMIKAMVKEAMQTTANIKTAEKKNRFPRTYIANDCKWSCEYRDICITELHGGDIKDLVKAGFETRDQRKAREKRERMRGELKRVG